MEIGITLLAVVALVVLIYLFVELKRLRHKVFALLLIAFIIFLYVSFIFVFKDRTVDFGSVDGVIEIGKVYFGWLGSIFGNVKTITGNIVKMEWVNFR